MPQFPSPHLDMPACPGATALYQAIANASQWKYRLLSSNPWEPGLGQGHNQKKDTHTLDYYDVTLLV